MSTTRLASLVASVLALASLVSTTACMEEPRRRSLVDEPSAPDFSDAGGTSRPDATLVVRPDAGVAAIATDAGSEPAVDAGPAVDPDTFVAGDWTLHRTCTTRRSCAAERTECETDRASSCAITCRTACTSGSGCGRCIDLCGDRFDCRSCAGVDGECTGWDYEFSRVNAMPDPAIEAACLLYADCLSGDFDRGVCTTFAANENAAVAIPAYDCYARTACADPSCSPAPDYATADRVCPFSSDPERDLCDGWGGALARDAAWWIPSTIEAAMLCATQPFGMRGGCVEALLTSLHAPT